MTYYSPSRRKSDGLAFPSVPTAAVGSLPLIVKAANQNRVKPVVINMRPASVPQQHVCESVYTR